MLEVKNVFFRYPATKHNVLQGVSLNLKEGEIGILLGTNGAGKSTLFQTITGIRKPNAGTVLLDGTDVSSLSSSKRAQRISYVPQTVTFGELTVKEAVLTGRLPYFHSHPSREDEEATETILAEMNLSDFGEQWAERLSGGQKQKVAIARALVGNPQCMIFDEPTRNLDLANQRWFIRELKRLTEKRNLSSLCSLHDIREAYELGDRFYFMKDGIIRYSGGKELFTDEIIEEIYGIRVHITHINNQIMITGGNEHE